MTSSEAPLLIQHCEKKVSSTGFALTVTDLAPLTDPAHLVHPNELGGIDKICQGLRVDPTIGLSSDEADETSTGKVTDGIKFAARRRAFGSNRYHNPEDHSRSGMIKTGVLMIGLLLSSIAAFWGMINLGELWELQSTKKKEEARKRKGSGQGGVVIALRDACEQELDVVEIQVGDILMLLPGGYVPVDGIVLKSHDLACDKSGAISEGIHLVSGTTVLSGSGSMLVTAVGRNLLANKARDSEDGLKPREIMMAHHAPKMCIALAITLLVVSFSRYFIMSMTNGSLPQLHGILADLFKIMVQVSQIILDSFVDSLLVCGLCLAVYVFVQLRKRRSVTEVLFKEYRRVLVNGAVLVCLAVSKNLFETGMSTIFQKIPTDATTLAYDNVDQRTLRSYVVEPMNTIRNTIAQIDKAMPPICHEACLLCQEPATQPSLVLYCQEQNTSATLLALRKYRMMQQDQLVELVIASKDRTLLANHLKKVRDTGRD
ncbi:hypothetical protein BGZ81_000857 [Podila clonocystis]|nr:hypothetical protein BGZ81_000857 [Podila clonocystis]